MKEQQIEKDLINKLIEQKYSYRDDICDRASLEKNFREKFEELNRVRLTDNEFSRLLEGIITPDVYNSARILRERNNGECQTVVSTKLGTDQLFLQLIS